MSDLLPLLRAALGEVLGGRLPGPDLLKPLISKARRSGACGCAGGEAKIVVLQNAATTPAARARRPPRRAPRLRPLTQLCPPIPPRARPTPGHSYPFFALLTI